MYSVVSTGYGVRGTDAGCYHVLKTESIDVAAHAIPRFDSRFGLALGHLGHAFENVGLAADLFYSVDPIRSEIASHHITTTRVLVTPYAWQRGRKPHSLSSFYPHIRL